jgi:acetyl-CoA synthetase
VLRRHGDRLEKMAGGFWRAQGRTYDTMNLGGIKVSSKELEQVLDSHPAVYEAAAVAVQAAGEGADKLVVFVRPAADEVPSDLKADLQREISTHLNPLFRIHDLVLSNDLPRTASGKLMRRILRRRYGA